MKIINFEPSNDILSSHRRERHFVEEFCALAINDGGTEIFPVVTVRLYKTAQRTSACIWIECIPDMDVAGSSINNSTYYEDQRAVRGAFESCGFEFDGSGLVSIPQMIEAVMHHLMYESFHIHYSHA